MNVNGIRAAVRRGMHPWLTACMPDVLTMQEVRATDSVLREQLGEAWRFAHAEPTVERHRGRAGVAIATRQPLLATRDGLDDPRFDGSGRWVEADVAVVPGAAGSATGLLTVVSTYVYTGEADTPRQEEKYAFLDAAVARMAKLAADGRHVLVTGDLNIAHREADLKNWKGNLTKSGFLVPERAYLDRLLADGWVDVGRELAGEGPGPYSWWSWRGKAFDNDAGWRIDYQLASPGLGALARHHRVDRAPTYAERWSDHAPVVVEYDVDLPTTHHRPDGSRV